MDAETMQTLQEMQHAANQPDFDIDEYFAPQRLELALKHLAECEELGHVYEYMRYYCPRCGTPYKVMPNVTVES